MIIPDANLLLYAYDQSCIFHEGAREWWNQCLSGREAVGLAHASIFAFMRVGTNPKAYANPMSLEEAAGYVNDWLDRRAVQVLQPPETHVSDVINLLVLAGGVAGNLMTDAQIAALAQNYRAVVHTADRDFLRFKEIQCHFPLDGKHGS